jgi:hypothetical protein
VTIRTLLPTTADLDLWIKNRYNVLLEGKHGVGKTESIRERLTHHYDDEWLYFSAPTMDPWVDFVGVPKEKHDPELGISYLELIRPKLFQQDRVRAIMFDEYNRAPMKIRNAVMELIQFKSINGYKFKNLGSIFCAINPENDETYDVERLDPAQRDRFQVQILIPYEVSREYFSKKYGHQGLSACDWWDRQTDAIRDIVSPRRLDFAMDMYVSQCDISVSLPFEANPSELLMELTDGASVDKLKSLMINQDETATRDAMAFENFFNAVEKLILSDEEYSKYFLPFFPKDKLVKAYLAEANARTALEEYNYVQFQKIFDPIIKKHREGKSTEDKLQFSVINKLIRWRDRDITDKISDSEFINLVSDSRMNIEYLTQEAKQEEIVTRFQNALRENVDLSDFEYKAMFGVSAELLSRTKNDNMISKILHVIKGIKIMRQHKNLSTLESHFNANLHGLRKAQNKETFEKVKSILTQNNVLDPRTIPTFQALTF